MPKNLTVRVLLAILIGACIGYWFPSVGVQLKLVSDLFIRCVKMVVAPIVFFTTVAGIGGMGSLKKVGVLGAKALLYFEVVTTLSLGIGLVVVTLVQPGLGIDVAALSANSPFKPPVAAPAEDLRTFFLNIVPDSAVGAFARGDMLPVLVFAILFGSALARQGEKGAALVATLDRLSHVFFGIIDMIMKLSPLAALGAMAYTVGQFGLGSLWALSKLMAAVYLTMALFIFGVLGSICRMYGFSILKLLKHIRGEILLVLGTSSSESALPSVMRQLTAAGCAPGVVGLVVPTGYSFNLDGTAIYLSMATLFITQAYGVTLSVEQLALTFGVLMLTSKGAAGVTGSGFITLAATLAALPGQHVPAEGIALVVGVDRFMSEARAITNLIGNSVATVVLAKAQGEFTDQGVL